LFAIPTTMRPRIWSGSMLVGVVKSAGNRATANPTVMTQAMTEIAPIIRLERVDTTVAIAQDRAAPRPPRIAIMAAKSDRPRTS